MSNLSQNVTPEILDRMYNNFVKMTDWLIKGKESQYPMPAPYAALFDSVAVAQKAGEQAAAAAQLVTTLQKENIELRQKVGALETTLGSINQTLAALIETQKQAQTQPVPEVIDARPVVAEPTPAPLAQAVAQPTPAVAQASGAVLADLGEVQPVQTGNWAPTQSVETHAQAQVSPNEQAIQVSAAAVGVGNLDPNSYAALDNEIDNLLSK